MATKVGKSTKIQVLYIFQRHPFHMLTSAYFITTSIALYCFMCSHTSSGLLAFVLCVNITIFTAQKLYKLANISWLLNIHCIKSSTATTRL